MDVQLVYSIYIFFLFIIIPIYIFPLISQSTITFNNLLDIHWELNNFEDLHKFNNAKQNVIEDISLKNWRKCCTLRAIVQLFSLKVV